MKYNYTFNKKNLKNFAPTVQWLSLDSYDRAYHNAKK